MALINIRLGDYIERSTENNSDLKYGEELITGVNSNGVFASPKGSTLGVDLKPYKIVHNGAFVYNPTRLDLGSLAYRTEGLCIVSHLYMIFYLTEEGKKIIDPQWLYIYFHRDEFKREVTFRNFGSQRPEFNFYDMSDIIIPLPDIQIQRKFVGIYNAMVANQECYESGLEDLKLVCDAYIEELRRKIPCEKIGAYIQECNTKNEGDEVTLFQGINVDHVFTDPKRIAEDSENGSIVRTGQFAFNKVMKANRTKLPIAYREGPDCVVSNSYQVFEVIDRERLNPKYLLLWFSRDETQRYAGFISFGTTRDIFTFEDMGEIEIPIPNMELQKDVVDIFSVYQERSEINEKLKSQLKNICPILIKGSIEEARKGA